MRFRNWSNFILCLIIIYSFLKFIPFFYDVFAVFSACMVGLKLSEWMMSVTRKYFLYKTVRSTNKAVLITGCDTGFGNILARRLDQRGYKVFAACLIPEGEGAKDLATQCSEKLTIIPMNVTDDQSIQEAKEFVAKNLGENVLWAVVNNAGISQAGEIDWTKFEDFQAVHDVNASGVLRVTKAFLPFIKKSKGRIVNMNSIAGHATLPGAVGYSMSKHSAVSLTTGLRLELANWGVKVIGIEPHFYLTNLTSTKDACGTIEKAWKNAPDDIREQYGEEYKDSYKEHVEQILNIVCNPRLYEVVDCMEDAVTAEDPLPVYSPGQLLSKIFLTLLLHVPVHIHDCLQLCPSIMRKKPAVLGPKKCRGD